MCGESSSKAHRRHLTPAQSSAIVLKHSEMLKVGDVQTQIDGVPRGTPLKSSKEVAKEAGVSKGTVDRTKKALAVAPEKAEAMISGKTTPTKVIHEERGEGCPVERIDSNSA